MLKMSRTWERFALRAMLSLACVLSTGYFVWATYALAYDLNAMNGGFCRSRTDQLWFYILLSLMQLLAGCMCLGTAAVYRDDMTGRAQAGQSLVMGFLHLGLFIWGVVIYFSLDHACLALYRGKYPTLLAVFLFTVWIQMVRKGRREPAAAWRASPPCRQHPAAAACAPSRGPRVSSFPLPVVNTSPIHLCSLRRPPFCRFSASLRCASWLLTASCPVRVRLHVRRKSLQA